MGSFLLLKLLDHLRPSGRNDFSDIPGYFVLKVSLVPAVHFFPRSQWLMIVERHVGGVATSGTSKVGRERTDAAVG